MREQAIQNPGFRKEAGVFLVGCKAQDAGEVAAQHDAQLAVLRDERHPVDERAEQPGRLHTIVLGLEALVEAGDTLTVRLRHVRMQQGRGLIRVRQERRQLGLAVFELSDLVLDLRARHAVEDRLDRLVQLALGALQLAALAREVGAALDPQPVHLARELGAELAEQLRLHQVRAQPVQDRRFQRVAADVDPVVAGALVARRRAAEQVLRDHRISATAAATLHQAGEQVLRSAPRVERVGTRLVRGIGQGHLPSLHRLPRLLVDDAIGRHLLHDPLALRIGPRHALARVGVLDVAEPVPHQPADIELVVEDTDAALRIAVDGRRSPLRTLRSGHAFAVQRERDRARRLAGEIVLEDPTDDGGLGLIDRPAAADRLTLRVEALDHVVAETQTAAGLAFLDPAAQAAAGLVGQILEVERAHRAFEADMQFAHLAFGQGDDRDAGEAHALVEAGDVLLVAREAVERLREDHIEPLPQPIGDQLLHARPQERRTGDRAVGVAVDHRPAFALGAGAAEPELVLDRGVALVVGRVAGVERDLHAATTSIDEAVARPAGRLGVDEFPRCLPGE